MYYFLYNYILTYLQFDQKHGSLKNHIFLMDKDSDIKFGQYKDLVKPLVMII